MRILLMLMAFSVMIFAADQNAKTTNKATRADDPKAKAADAWVEKMSKGDALPANVPTWWGVFGALERKYGVGKVPCGVFDAAREQFFQEFVMPWALKNGYDTEGTRRNFMKESDLPTTWTLTGRKRQGCIS